MSASIIKRERRTIMKCKNIINKMISILMLCFLEVLFPCGHVSAEVYPVTITPEGGEMNVLLGDTGQFSVEKTGTDSYGNTYQTGIVTYSSSDEEIVSVDENGVFQTLSVGNATITISVYREEQQNGNVTVGHIESGHTDTSIGYTSLDADSWDDNDWDDSWSDDWNSNGDSNSWDNSWNDDSSREGWLYTAYYYLSVYPDLSGVTLDKDSDIQYITDMDWSLPQFTFHLNSSFVLNEETENVNVNFESSNQDVGVSGGLKDNIIVIEPYNVGSTTVTVTINEKQFQIKIKTVVLRISKNSLLMSTKQSRQMKVKGTKEKITWSSSNKKVVSVSKSGKLKAKKNGNAVIKAKLGNCQLGCAVSVVSKQRMRAVKKAMKIGQTSQYSQEKRMQNGYYDCSSLVWRAYHSNGNNFGNKTYAPVAADQGKWCVKHKRVVKGGLSDKNIAAMKIHAGDLMFETSDNKTRFRGIYHVEMISGYICYGFSSDGKPILGITWANRPVDYYWHGGQLVGRP